MSIGPCIPDLIENGVIPKGKGAEAQRLYDEMLPRFARQYGAGTAEAMASEAVVRQLEAAVLLKKRQTLLQINAQMQALESIRGYGGGKPPGEGGSASSGANGGPINPKAVIALFDRDAKASYSNVEGRRKAIKARAHARLDQVLAKHSRNVWGEVRQRAQLDEIGRELFGEATGSANARELADAWSTAAEELRTRFNAAGGAIGKLDRWGLPQSHDSRAVRAAGYQTWRDTVVPLLDRERMIDRATGLPFTDEGLEQVLREVFETIRTDGWSKITPGATGTAKLANRHADHRFLHFKDYDAWSAYQADFGQGTAFDAMMGHIEMMSRDIATMEILGPNPTATVRWLGDQMERTAALDAAPDSKAVERAFAGRKQMQRLFDEISGTSRRPENRKLAIGFSALRSVQTSAKLGSATLSAVTDTGFQMMTRKFNGLPVTGMMRDYVKLLNPANSEDRKLAVRMGLIADEWSAIASAQSRYLNEELTGETARRLAEGVLRASGLSAWTQAGRWAFGMEFVGHITHEAGKSFDQLDPAFARALNRYGIGAGEWDKVRATPARNERGADWIFPQDIADRAIGDKVMEMIAAETDFAVPTADLRTRAMINSVAPRGTIQGEIIRSGFLFKSFGISMILTHGRRMMEQTGLINKARYAAGMFISLSVTGALAVEMKEIAKGRDPRPMDSKEFWFASALQGGGFGIFGDFLGASESRFGGGWAEVLSGPVVQTASGVADMTVGNVAKAVRGDKTDVGRDALRLVKQETPGSSLWYARLALERLILDQLSEAIDPNYRQSWRRMEKRAEEQGQDYYWAPGDLSPERAPDLDNAFGEGGL